MYSEHTQSVLSCTQASNWPRHDTVRTKFSTAVLDLVRTTRLKSLLVGGYKLEQVHQALRARRLSPRPTFPMWRRQPAPLCAAP